MIIGLLGRSRVGKDTAANAIVTILGTDNTDISRLSQPLKDAAQILYGFTTEQVEDGQKEVVDPRYGLTPRVCIQRMCDHLMSQHGVDFFSRQFYQRHTSTNKVIIVPDIRYEHDIRHIRQLGGVIIKVERPSVTIPRHQWEDHIDGLCGDFHVINDSSIKKLEHDINRILCNIGLA